MNVIDFHTHAFSGAIAEKAMAHLVDESGYTPSHDGTLRGLKRALADAGVTRAVVLSIATRPKQVSVINDWAIARGAEDNPALPDDSHRKTGGTAPSAPDNSTDSLVFFGTLHPQFTNFEYEIERLRAAAIPGIKFHPNYQEFFPDDPILLPMFRAIAKAGMIALFHAGFDIAFPDAPGSPDRLARLAGAVPDLQIVCAHFGGWRQWDLVDRHLVGLPNVYFDTSFTLGDLPDERFLDMARRHGMDRILFGTDSPWRDHKEDLDHLDRLPLTATEREAILWENASRLLNHSVSDS